MLNKIKSKYIPKLIGDYLNRKTILSLVQYNKKLQEKLDISIKDYIKYSNEIIIELTPNNPLEEGEHIFINIPEKSKQYFHIYFNNNDIEEQKKNITDDDNINKIKIVIDGEVISFKELFKNCKCLKKINIVKCIRNNIKNMYAMFENCSSLIELNIDKLNTDNVETMRAMFCGCSSLKTLNLSNFNTKNVQTMYGMLSHCSSLVNLNVNNFDTSNVKNMAGMLYKCSSLEELNITNFNTDSVMDLREMFYEGNSLINLDISNLNLKRGKKTKYMLACCSEQLQELVKSQKTKLKKDLFYNPFDNIYTEFIYNLINICIIHDLMI